MTNTLIVRNLGSIAMTYHYCASYAFFYGLLASRLSMRFSITPYSRAKFLDQTINLDVRMSRYI